MSDIGVFVRLSLALGGNIIYLSGSGIYNIMKHYVFLKNSIPLPPSLVCTHFPLMPLLKPLSPTFLNLLFHNTYICTFAYLQH